MKRFLRTWFCFATFATGIPAQTRPSGQASDGQQPTFRAGGEEVVMDVVVRDKKNRPVKDLKQDDFAVIDNGEKRPIRSFRFIEGTEAVNASGATTQLDPMRQIRLLTLIFDGLDPNGRKLSRDAGLSLLKDALQPNVFISVMAIDFKLEAIQPFTNDRDLLKKAIEHATAGVTTFASDTARIEEQLQQLLGPNQAGQGLGDQVASMSPGGSGQSGPAGAANGPGAANIAMAQMMLNMLQSKQQDEATDQGRAKIVALLQVVKEQYTLPGRKTILYFSPGFQIPQGMEEPFKSVISIANRSNVSFYALDARGLDISTQNGKSDSQLTDAMSASEQNMKRGNVSRANAQSADMAIESGRANTQNTLAQLADSTGGFLIANTNDFSGKLKRLTEDLESYYEITYDPQIQKYDGSFRKVSVRTDRSDLRLQSRAGYFALPPSMTAQAVLSTYEVPLLKALVTMPLPHTFGFETSAMHFEGTHGSSVCVLVVDIPIGNLTLQQDKATKQFEGQFAYVALVKDSRGQVVKKIRNEIPLKMDPGKVDAIKASSHFIDTRSFDLPPGRYTLESAVLDSDGNRISARKSVFFMPAVNSSLGISSVAVIRDLKLKGSTTDDDPLLVSNQVVSPMINPIVKKADAKALPFYVVIYPSKTNPGKPTLQMEFSKDGQLLGSGSPPLGNPDAQGRIQYMATAPLGQLAPGNYQVRFIARQGNEIADESVTFTLDP
ncbi:MAG: VWA domain-containing protein [Bryobacteraceae bacterium]